MEPVNRSSINMPRIASPTACSPAAIRAQGADVLFQQHQRRHTDFRKGRRLGARDPVVAWPKPKIRPGWMTREQYDAFPATLEIREVKIKSRVRVTTLCMA